MIQLPLFEEPYEKMWEASRLGFHVDVRTLEAVSWKMRIFVRDLKEIPAPNPCSILLLTALNEVWQRGFFRGRDFRNDDIFDHLYSDFAFRRDLAPFGKTEDFREDVLVALRRFRAQAVLLGCGRRCVDCGRTILGNDKLCPRCSKATWAYAAEMSLDR